MRVYVGSFTASGAGQPEQSEGIFLCRLDPASGHLEKVAGFPGGPSPAFLAFSGDGRCLYAVNEVNQFQGLAEGGVSAFAVDPRDGGLKPINSQPSGGPVPCYLSLDQSGRWLLVANYTGGNAAVFPLAADGSLGPRCELAQHAGHGPRADRQEQAHVHSIRMAPTHPLALAADLGLDQVRLYTLDADSGRLRPHRPAAIAIHPGAGPRHLDFHPNGRWLYVLNELDSTLDVFACDANAAAFRCLQTTATLPGGCAGENWPADVHVHPGGRWVIASNRGHDSLAVFAIDPADGRVSLAHLVPSGGKYPLNFSIDPSGRWLVTANQLSDNLSVFALDETTGQLTPAGEPLAMPAPSCVVFGANQ
jgi:6-phosphogluconolactonase